MAGDRHVSARAADICGSRFPSSVSATVVASAVTVGAAAVLSSIRDRILAEAERNLGDGRDRGRIRARRQRRERGL